MKYQKLKSKVTQQNAKIFFLREAKNLFVLIRVSSLRFRVPGKKNNKKNLCGLCVFV